MEQTISVRIKCLKPNADKRDKLEHQQREFVRACRWFAGEIEKLGTTSCKKLHQALYRRARQEFDLNAGVLQYALLKAQSAFKAYWTVKRKGKKAERPTFSDRLPVSVRQDLYKLEAPGFSCGEDVTAWYKHKPHAIKQNPLVRPRCHPPTSGHSASSVASQVYLCPATPPAFGAILASVGLLNPSRQR